MTIQQAYQQLLVQLYEIYDEREAANIAEWVIEHITGFKRIDRIINKEFPLNEQQRETYKTYTDRLLQNEPVQYVLGEAYFAGMKLFVDENVLIPRPETEELVEWIIEEVEGRKLKMQSERSKGNISLIDIGTGSGCIPIALKKRIDSVDVAALDVSEGALSVARKNAQEQQTPIDFIQLDFLIDSAWSKVGSFDIIVSNPPYIKENQKDTMNKNVLNHEPHLALFVPDEDALLFYRKIAFFAKDHLNKGSSIFLEINEALGSEVKKLFKDHGYASVEIRKDMQGKERMIRVTR